MKAPRYIFDGFNFLEPEVVDLGFHVEGVGRVGSGPRHEETPQTVRASL